ncbi:MAG: response regulator [bacterium]|nr:response regulator [bacterium]
MRKLLLGWFLVLALLPLVSSCLLLYGKAKSDLHNEVANRLTEISRFKNGLIGRYYTRALDELEHQCRLADNVELLQALRKESISGEFRTVDFVRSRDAAKLAEGMSQSLHSSRRTYGYLDALLIDRDGDILFSLERDHDLGANIFDPPFASHGLRQSFERTMIDGHAASSDIHAYPPADSLPACFLTQALHDVQGNMIGALAIRLDLRGLEAIVGNPAGLGATGRTYMVGIDRRLRTGDNALRERIGSAGAIDTEVVEYWRMSGRVSVSQVDREGKTPFLYTDSRGDTVLGLYVNHDYGGIRYGVITEIQISEAYAHLVQLRTFSFAIFAVAAILLTLIAVPVSRYLTDPLQILSDHLLLVAQGNFDHRIDIQGKNDLYQLAYNFNTMLSRLHVANTKHEKQLINRANLSRLATLVLGKLSIEELSAHIITFFCKELNVPVGSVYYAENDQTLRQVASYALPAGTAQAREFAFGEGLVGQCAIDKSVSVVNDASADYLQLSSGFGNLSLRQITAYPIVYNNQIKAVIELGSQTPINEDSLELLDQARESLAVAFVAAESRERVERLLIETRQQAQTLRHQKESLKRANLDGERRTKALEDSRRELQSQQTELEVNKSELERRNMDLEKQRNEIRSSNRNLRRAQIENAIKTRAIEQADKYKSEFLANMSHELRTPLNSMLLLAQTLADNKSGGMTSKDVKSAETILSSGRNLLTLIDDILSLAKAESGKIELMPMNASLQDIASNMETMFEPIAQDKDLKFTIQLADDLPPVVYLDKLRVEQVIRNLLGNAFKFTSEGLVALIIFRPVNDPNLIDSGIDDKQTVAFAVTDTGIGIADDPLEHIFNAFRQADGTTSRRFGGTGLGLSISSEYAKLMGGLIAVDSEVGMGSTFTFYLPLDRESGSDDDLPDDHLPEVALFAPCVEGEPVSSDDSQPEISPSAAEPSTVSPPDSGTLLILSRTDHLARAITQALQDAGPIEIIAHRSVDSAMDILRSRDISCLLIDHDEVKKVCDNMLEGLLTDRNLEPPPIIIHADRQIGKDRLATLDRHHRILPILVASDAEETIADVCQIMLEDADAASTQKTGQPARFTSRRNILKGKSVLIVDNDMRNVFRLISGLHDMDIEVSIARNGSECLKELTENGNIDLMLMNIQMTGMDAYKTIQKVRTQARFLKLPIIAMTAQAMQADRRRCIQAGANDYLIKPVNLKSLELKLKTWLLSRSWNLPQTVGTSR